jgi:hypothetical protein
VVRCYLSDGNEAEHYNIVRAVNDCAKELGFRVSVVGEPAVGSILQEVFLKGIRALPDNELLKRLRMAFHAIAGTSSLAAVQGLRDLVASNDNVVIQMNALLLVKTTAADGKTAIVIRELNETQLERIATQTGILSSPQQLLDELDSDETTRGANKALEATR